MKPILPSLLLALCASPAPAQTAAPQVTRDQAMTLPPQQLADLVLREFGAQVRSMTHPNFGPSSDMRMVSALQGLTFATAPRAAETMGLCVASRIDVDFERAADDANEAATPVRVRDVRAVRVYKVVGQIGPRAEASESRRVEENGRCADAGPVIEADYSSRGRPHFFTFDGATEPMTALLVLQRAIGEARAGRALDIRCVAGPLDCRAQLGALELANLDYIDIAPLGVDGNRNLYRIGASFLIEGDSIYRHYRIVAIEGEIADFGHGPDPIRRVGRIEMNENEIYH